MRFIVIRRRRPARQRGVGLAVKLLLVHSRHDLHKSNFVVAEHKGVRPSDACMGRASDVRA